MPKPSRVPCACCIDLFDAHVTPPPRQPLLCLNGPGTAVFLQAETRRVIKPEVPLASQMTILCRPWLSLISVPSRTSCWSQVVQIGSLLAHQSQLLLPCQPPADQHWQIRRVCSGKPHHSLGRRTLAGHARMRRPLSDSALERLATSHRRLPLTAIVSENAIYRPVALFVPQHPPSGTCRAFATTRSRRSSPHPCSK